MATVQTGTFQDVFDVLDSRWNGNYGGASVTGGMARIPCGHTGGVPNYAGFQSTSAGLSDTWTLASSHVYGKLVTVPAISGATSAWCQMAVLSNVTSGTYLSILYDAASGVISFTSRVAFADPAAVYLPYDPIAHKWLRIRHTSGTLYWEGSPDGLTWTSQRTLSPDPAWITTDAVTVLLDGARDAGTNDYIEWDNLNITPATPASVTATTAIGTPGLSLGTTVIPGPVPATTAIGAPGLSAGTTVTPGTVPATTAIGVPTIVYIPLPALCGTATVTALGGTAVAHSLTGTATVEGSPCLP